METAARAGLRPLVMSAFDDDYLPLIKIVEAEAEL